MKLLKTILLAFLIFALPSMSETKADNIEFKIKAGYIYNFIKFVTWPKSSSNTFNICLLGQDQIRLLLQPIENRTAFGLPIKLVQLKSPTNYQSCQILYVGSEQQGAFFAKYKLLKTAERNNLLVGDGEDFADLGGMICFVNRDGNIKLRANLDAVHKSNLSFSAMLLEVAEVMTE